MGAGFCDRSAQATSGQRPGSALARLLPLPDAARRAKPRAIEAMTAPQRAEVGLEYQANR
jgi:hypothetical protein